MAWVGYPTHRLIIPVMHPALDIQPTSPFLVVIERRITMEYLCIRDCTIRVNNKSIYFQADQIVEFEEAPKAHFVALEDADINFDTATLEMLQRSNKWEVKEALEYLKDKYGFTSTAGPLTRKETSALIIDMRYRKVSIPQG